MSFAQSFNFDIETKVMGSLYCIALRIKCVVRCVVRRAYSNMHGIRIPAKMEP